MNELIEQVTNGITPFKSPNEVAEVLSHLEQPYCPVYNHIYPGIYMREGNYSPGVLAVGHKHRHQHTCILMVGKVTLIEVDGTRKTLEAPQIFLAEPGQKIAFFHEPTSFINVYAIDETNIEVIEETIFDKSQLWFETRHVGERVEDREDFHDFLKAYGYANIVDFFNVEKAPLPYGTYKFTIAESAIDGKGIFATADIEPKEVIAPLYIDGKLTVLGRYINHSKRPNAYLAVNTYNSDLTLVALKGLKGCMGGNPGNEITIDYRATF